MLTCLPRNENDKRNALDKLIKLPKLINAHVSFEICKINEFQCHVENAT